MENDILPAFADLDLRLPELSITQLVSWTASCSMMFGGIVPFIPQYVEIKRSDNAEGFSTYVCLILLIASTLRILFWFGHPYELPLLAQSMIMFVTMMALLRVCTRIRALDEIATTKRKFTERPPSQSTRRYEDGQPKESVAASVSPEVSVTRSKKGKSFTDFDSRYFWKWHHFGDYCLFMLLFCLACGLLTYIFANNIIFIEVLGFLAVFIEALLGAPQFYRNFENKSTQGMSVSMVCFWLSGDTFKTGYFIVKAAPVQFTFCGLLQVFIDLAILSQVFYYRNRTRLKPAPKISLSDEHIS